MPPNLPSTNLNPHLYRVILYVIFDVKKEKPLFLYISLASGGYCPTDLLVKCEYIYFCTNLRIWIGLGEKYGTTFGLLIYYPKN